MTKGITIVFIKEYEHNIRGEVLSKKYVKSTFFKYIF